MAKNLILVDKNTGTVAQTIYSFDDRTYQPQSDVSYVPYIMDDSLSPIVITEVTTTGVGGLTASQTLTLPPITEQKLTGTVYGEFDRGELLFQSSIHPTLINNYAPGGVTATAYNPLVVTGVCVSSGTIVGEKCAQFMGSYLDTDTQAACLRISDYAFPGSSMPYFMASGFMYLSSTPSGAYDPIVFAKTTSGTAGTVNDCFQFEYDNSATRMLLMVSSDSYASTGYEYTINASPTGVSLDHWHHFAFAYSNQGNSACVSTYWNGTRITKQTGLSGNIRFKSSPYSIGGGPHGDKPFKGYMDDLVVSGGTSSTALRGIQHGTTCTIPTESQSSGEYTIFHISFHGPEGTSIFPVSGPSKVISTHIFDTTDPDTEISNLYVGSIDVVQNSVHGTSLAVGISSGHVSYVNGGSYGYVFGYESGACIVPTSVQQLLNINTVKAVKTSLMDNTQLYLLGSTAMRGTTGSSGDFPRLYSGAFTGGNFTFKPTKQKIEDLRTLYDGIILSGQTVGTYNIVSDDGISYAFSVRGITSLYADVTNYYTRLYQDTSAVQATVSGSSTISAIRTVQGLTRDSFVQKLSAQVGANSPALTITAVSKTTKKYVVPENVNTVNPSGVIPIEGDGAFTEGKG